MRLAVIGDLDPTQAQLVRLGSLGLDVLRCPPGTDSEKARRTLEASSFAFFNNVDVNPLLDAATRLRLGVLACTGYQFVDLERARALQVPLAYLPGYSTRAVVEYVLQAALKACRERGGELFGSAVGMVGYGRIGSGVGDALAALGCGISATTRVPRSIPGVTWQALEALMASSDVVVVACALNETTVRLLDGSVLERLHHGATLVSIAPNEVIDLRALADVLSNRHEARAVLDLDPLEPDHPLLALRNVRVTPHVAFATEPTFRRRIDHCIDEVATSLNGGEPTWVPELAPGREPTRR